MTTPDEAVPVEQLSFTEASRELDSIVNFFEQREVDVDVLVGRLACRRLLFGEWRAAGGFWLRRIHPG